jgi:hypothetical protein
MSPDGETSKQAPASSHERDRELGEKRKAAHNLLAMVDGAQKALAPNPERYLCRDGSGAVFWELSGSNLRQKQMVQLHVFSDVVVVTSRKKNIMTGKNKVVFDKSWGLLEASFADLPDSTGRDDFWSWNGLRSPGHPSSALLGHSLNFTPGRNGVDVSHAIKISKHPDSFLYRADKEEEKRALLFTIKRTTDALVQQMRREREMAGSNPLLLTASAADMLAPQGGFESGEGGEESSEYPPAGVAAGEEGGLGQSTKQAASLPSAKGTGGKGNWAELTKDDIPIGDFHWLMELPDELDVLIAHRHFQAAVAGIEKGRRLLAKATAETPRIALAWSLLEQRTTDLARQINLELASPVSTKFHVQQNINLLLRIGLGDQVGVWVCGGEVGNST